MSTGLKSVLWPYWAPTRAQVSTTMSIATVKARIDSTVKAESEAVLRSLGMDMSGAIKVFLRQVVMQGGLPFEVRLQPNARTLAAITDSYNDKMESAESLDAMFADLER